MAGAPRGARAPHAVQRAAASELLAALRQRTGVSAGPSSKSHSRDLVAAALAEAGRVGIDVEYRAPGRRIEQVAQHIMHAPVADADAAYRAFTFWEAYFKAFGDWPDKALMRVVAASTERLMDVGGVSVLHHSVETDFALTLVWDHR